jgi:hypothetical protein
MFHVLSLVIVTTTAANATSSCHKPWSSRPTESGSAFLYCRCNDISINIKVRYESSSTRSSAYASLCGTRVWCNGLISNEKPKRKSFERGNWFDERVDAHPHPPLASQTWCPRPTSTKKKNINPGCKPTTLTHTDHPNHTP